MGKSMRANRLKKILCKGWVANGAQQSSVRRTNQTPNLPQP